MAEINKMSRQKLRQWIHNLEISIKQCDDPHNLELFKKWHKEACDEIIRRDTARMNYCKRNGIK